MAECVIVMCESVEEVAKARALWENPDWGLKILDGNPVTKFEKVRVYEFDAAAPDMKYRENGRYALIYTG